MNGRQKRGGRAYHSVLEPHFEFIRDLRRQRKTWREIAEALRTEKGVEVTLYAPYFFYKRRLVRSRTPHWETASPAEAPPKVARPIPHGAPVLPVAGFRRPDLGTFNTEDYT